MELGSELEGGSLKALLVERRRGGRNVVECEWVRSMISLVRERGLKPDVAIPSS